MYKYKECMVAQTQKTLFMNKTYIYHSNLNKMVVAIIATNRNEADKFLMERLNNYSVIIKDDFILYMVVNQNIGDSDHFTIID
jgi:hypothetical protein